MVVHDMRNPTNQIEFLISQTLKILKEIRDFRLNYRNQNENGERQARRNMIEEEEKVENINDCNSIVAVQNQQSSKNDSRSFKNQIKSKH